MDESAKNLDDLPAMIDHHRREGFPGQHHVVLPAPVIAAAAAHPLARGLFPTDAGQYPAARGHFVSRPSGAAGAVLIVCTAGRGWVRHDGALQHVAAGGVIFIGPRTPHSYGADAGDPWTIEWAHLAGEEMPAWRDTVAGDGCLLQLHPTAAAGIGLARVHEHLEAGYDETHLLLAAAALRHSLARLLKFRRVPGHAPTAVEAVEATADWMRQHLASPVTLAGLARQAGMSSSRYSDIFRQRFGYPPIDWFMRQRVRQACHLLDTTRDKVEVVGMEVGFRDSCYFSRSFRKVMGCGPRDYRAVPKG